MSTMLTITSVVGNLASDPALAKERGRLSSTGKVETVLVSRLDAQRSRMRKRSDAGTDIAIALEEGDHLDHGDILLATGERMIVVMYEPEDVLRFRIREGLPEEERVELAVRLGHMIGNLHRPIGAKGGEVLTPIQSASEAERMVKAMGEMARLVEVEQVRMVFEPEEGTSSHAH